jgi:hypothetical protein
VEFLFLQADSLSCVSIFPNCLGNFIGLIRVEGWAKYNVSDAGLVRSDTELAENQVPDLIINNEQRLWIALGKADGHGNPSGNMVGALDLETIPYGRNIWNEVMYLSKITYRVLRTYLHRLVFPSCWIESMN